MINPVNTFVGFTGSCLSSLSCFGALCMTAYNEYSCRTTDYTDMCAANTASYLKFAAVSAGALVLSINILHDEYQKGMR